MQAAAKARGLKSKNSLQTNYTFEDTSQKSIKINLLRPKNTRNDYLGESIQHISQGQIDQSNNSFTSINQLLQVPQLKRRNYSKNDPFNSLYKSSRLQKSSTSNQNQNLLISKNLLEKPQFNHHSNNLVQKQLMKSINSDFNSEPSMIKYQNAYPRQQSIINPNLSSLEQLNKNKNQMNQMNIENISDRQQIRSNNKIKIFNFQDTLRYEQRNTIISQHPEQARNYIKTREFLSPQYNIQKTKNISPRINMQKPNTQTQQKIYQELKLKANQGDSNVKDEQMILSKCSVRKTATIQQVNDYLREGSKRQNQRQLYQNRQMYRQLKKDKNNLQNDKIFPLLKLQILRDIEKAQRSLTQLHSMIQSSHETNTNAQLILYYQIRRTIRNQINDHLEATIQDIKPFQRISNPSIQESRRLI